VSASFSQPKIGATIGVNVSDFNHTKEVKRTIQATLEFQIGIIADFSIDNNMSVIPELLFSRQGGSVVVNSDSNPELSMEVSQKITYLQLPVNLAYKFNVGRLSNIIPFAGPYLSYGLSAPAKVKGSTNTEPISEKVGVTQSDFGLNFGVTYQRKKIFVRLHHNRGFEDFWSSGGDAAANKHTALAFGYYIF
jgi:hypothetical protein